MWNGIWRLGKFTALEVKRMVTPGRFGDGGGLWLQVREGEQRDDPEEKVFNKSWLLRFTLNGRAREMGLGPVDLVSLAEARDKAVAARKLLLEGMDPIDERAAARAARLAKAGAMTFQHTAERYIAAHSAGWKNEKHQAQWTATLKAYVYPEFGKRLVADVDTGDVMKALEPIWTVKPETAGRVRGRIEVILDYAKSRGWRAGENPARWKGHVANLLPTKTKVRAVEHHAALAWAEIGPFMATLRGEAGTGALALQFCILTAARTGEVIGARWAEIDLDAKTWRLPPERMKAKREHRVPLSAPVLAILAEMAKLRAEQGNDPLVFPGARAGKPMSNMSMAMLLRRMAREDITVHGFRSTFRDWVGETTAYPADLAEAALAHTVGDKTVAAYARGDLFEKRRKLMDEWAAFCAQPPYKLTADIVPIRQAG
jgi:integrase